MNKVCFFGSYSPDYPRNLLTKKAFKKLGYRVIECNDQGGGLIHYLNLLKKFIKNGRECNFIFVGVVGHYDLLMAFLFGKIFNKKIIFDAFYSLYDTYILDRKQYHKFSFQSWRFFFYDFISIRLADIVILDSKENIDFMARKYKVNNPGNFFELPVSADPHIFFKRDSITKNKSFTLGFYGSFLPLHGVNLIVNCIKLLKDEKIRLLLLGKGPGLNSIKNKVKKLKLDKKIKFLKPLSYENLPNFYQKIDLFLAGPFGSTDKAERVLPAKVAEALAMEKDLVVAKTKTTKRLLKGFDDIYWLNEKNPNTLKDLILNIKNKKNFPKKTKNYFSKSILNFENFVKNLSLIISKK